MAIICKTFSEAVDSALSAINSENLFEFIGDEVKPNGEGLKNLSVTLLSTTNAIINNSELKALEQIIRTWLEDDIEMEDVTDKMIENVIDQIEKAYNQYKYLKKELRASVDETKNLPRLTSALFDKFIGDNTLKLFSK